MISKQYSQYSFNVQVFHDRLLAYILYTSYMYSRLYSGEQLFLISRDLLVCTYVRIWILGDRRAEIRIRKLIAKKGICRVMYSTIDLVLYPLLHVFYTIFNFHLTMTVWGRGVVLISRVLLVYLCVGGGGGGEG